MSRMSGAGACLNCGATYHIVFNRSEDGGRLRCVRRQAGTQDDDKPETVKKRLDVYHDQISR